MKVPNRRGGECCSPTGRRVLPVARTGSPRSQRQWTGKGRVVTAPAGYTEMFRNCAVPGLCRGAWKSGDGFFKQLLNNDFLIDGLLDPAYTDRARFVRDMRKYSVIKHGIFPDAQCLDSRGHLICPAKHASTLSTSNVSRPLT